MKNKIDLKQTVIAVAAAVLIIAGMLFAGSKKAHYHMDEICTFGLSNGVLHMEHELGKTYSGQELLIDYVTADADNRFNYKQVWENQGMDVHPPLYYIFIHTLSSLMPGQFTNIIGLVPNIFFALIICWQMYWMLSKFTSRLTALVMSLLYIFSVAFVNIVVFFRMYALLTLVTNALFMLFMRYTPKADKDKDFFINLYIIVAIGMLTQYYFSIICIIACGIYGLQLLLEKRIKDIVGFVVAGTAGVGTAVVVFPKMLQHIFFGYRGKQAVTALINDGLVEGAKTMFSHINIFLFGGISFVVVALVLVLWFVNRTKLQKNDGNDIVYMLVQFMLPALVYICVVSKIAPFKDVRYITNVTAVIFAATFAVVFILAKNLGNKGSVLAVILAAAMVLGSYQNGVPNLYTADRWKGTILSDKSDVPCVYVYDYNWRVISNYVEMKHLNEITFLDPSTIDMIDEDRFKNLDTMLVYISNDVVGTEFLDRIVANNPEIDGYEVFIYSGYSTCYLLD